MRDDGETDNDLLCGVLGTCTQDTDGDSIPDTSDNCPDRPNTNQLNNDGDAEGNVCDHDDDNDGINDWDENDGCIFDADSACGVVVILDTDDDGIPDSEDNCPNQANPTQLNTDDDTLGNSCDNDDDNDGILDGDENEGCRLDADINCGIVVLDTETDVDKDSVLDENDNCLNIANIDQLDTDGDTQ